jgi:hypothetical protein
VIADLARWGDWSVIDKLVAIYTDATPENLFVREPIVNYMKACPLPEAKVAMEKLREIDPEAVRRAATLAGLAGLTAAGPAGETAESPNGSPARVAEVVADDVETDGTMVVSPGVRPTAPSSAGKPAADTPPAAADQPGAPVFRWAFWVAVVVVIAFISRAVLRSGRSGSPQ